MTKAAITRGKVPFGTAKHSPIKNVRYLSWEDAFDVEFDDGLCILEPHATIRRANQIAPEAKFKSLQIVRHQRFAAVRFREGCERGASGIISRKARRR